jgi:hypothetical protein
MSIKHPPAAINVKVLKRASKEMERKDVHYENEKRKGAKA